jgi:broad specificity phosphatase PhoE
MTDSQTDPLSVARQRTEAADRAPTADATTIVYLVRHGETIWNAEERCQGQADADFSDRGRAQLEALAEELASIRFDAAYTSPLVRAVRTAEAILADRGVRARRVAALSEISYGTLQGTRFADWPGTLLDTWRADPWSVAFPDGESLAALEARVLPAFDRIVAAHPGDTVLVSSHGHVNRLILAAQHRRSRADFWSIEQINGRAIRLECRAPRTT